MNFIYHHKCVAKSKHYTSNKNVSIPKAIQPKQEKHVSMPPQLTIPAVEPVIPKKIYSIIPLNIFQTWYTLDLPPKMKENVDLLKTHNPEFTHYLYDDEMCREFIKNNFDEDVLYAFDKLKPGAYKADLWRYCVLYIHGGIYLDIKFKCVNQFKLIELTDKEYYVKDISFAGNNGIYQAFMVNLPGNSSLLNTIHTIVQYCTQNTYTTSSLCVTGPGLLYHVMSDDQYVSYELQNIGHIIVKNNTYILVSYPEYRMEQSNTQKTSHYSLMWEMKDAYNYPTLTSTTTYNFSKNIQKTIDNNTYTFYRGTPTLIEYEDNYLVNIQWVNYTFHKNGSMDYKPRKWISLHSRFLADKQFNPISNEIFLEENNTNGLEDIRLFSYENQYYYIATYFDKTRHLTSISSDVYHISNDTYVLNRQVILPDMYDTHSIKIHEKNWTFVNYQNELCVVYKWCPLQIGKVDYITNTMNLLEIKYNIPDYFKQARGSTCGYTNGNEIWFVLHQKQVGMYVQNYQHFFAIFDLNMNLIKYSEFFKFGDCKVEYCTGLIVQENNVILSYSLLDTQCFVSEYSLETIYKLKWYVS
jgi:hypothetical protein